MQLLFLSFGNEHFKTFSSNVSHIYYSVATTQTYILKLSNSDDMGGACIRHWWNKR